MDVAVNIPAAIPMITVRFAPEKILIILVNELFIIF
jgi:hypothetical protein